jgi:hypothetical protein
MRLLIDGTLKPKRTMGVRPSSYLLAIRRLALHIFSYPVIFGRHGLKTPAHENLCRDVATNGTFVRPRKQHASGIGTQTMGLGLDPHTTQIQSIRIPASLQGRISLSMTIRMKPTRLEKHFKSGVIQVH